MTLDWQAADRLTKLLGMLGSNSDGERANAALMADRFVHGLGLTWHDVINTPLKLQTTIAEDWEVWANYCLAHVGRLSFKEQSFIRSMYGRKRQPTSNQYDWLKGIYDRLQTGTQ